MEKIINNVILSLGGKVISICINSNSGFKDYYKSIKKSDKGISLDILKRIVGESG